jgi:hypothetical protein
MKTGKMKQLLYTFSFITLFAFAGNAQVAAGAVASSILAKPVVLTDVEFKAAFVNNAGTISWHSTAQIKVRRYELEKSMDGENFAYITAFAGTQKNYTAEDNNLSEGVTYYRLKIVDEEGNFLYSSTQQINTKIAANEIKILPTQLDKRIFVWLPANTTISSAVITDATGRTIYNTSVSNITNIATVETIQLPAGVYSIKLHTSKGEIVKLKFNKSL